jgi:hypothetical protein
MIGWAPTLTTGSPVVLPSPSTHERKKGSKPCGAWAPGRSAEAHQNPNPFYPASQARPYSVTACRWESRPSTGMQPRGGCRSSITATCTWPSSGCTTSQVGPAVQAYMCSGLARSWHGPEMVRRFTPVWRLGSPAREKMPCEPYFLSKSCQTNYTCAPPPPHPQTQPPTPTQLCSSWKTGRSWLG